MKSNRRTTVFLDAELDLRSQRVKEAVGMSQTELIRRGMRLILSEIEQKYGIGVGHESTAA
jgi:hypothetical protein